MLVGTISRRPTLSYVRSEVTLYALDILAMLGKNIDIVPPVTSKKKSTCECYLEDSFDFYSKLTHKPDYQNSPQSSSVYLYAISFIFPALLYYAKSHDKEKVKHLHSVLLVIVFIMILV